MFDDWESSGKLIIQNPLPKSFTNAAIALWERGYAFDHLSDRFLAKARCADGRVMLGGNGYRAILVPGCIYMPAATLSNLVALANGGANILFQGNLPTDVPGFGNLDARRAEFQQIIKSIKLADSSTSGVQSAVIGKGRVLVGKDADVLLQAAAVFPANPALTLRASFCAPGFYGRTPILCRQSRRPSGGWLGDVRFAGQIRCYS